MAQRKVRDPKELLVYYRDEIDALQFRSVSGPDSVDRELLDTAADILIELEEELRGPELSDDSDRRFHVKVGFLQMLLWRADAFTRSQLKQQLDNDSVLHHYWSAEPHPNSCPACRARAIDVKIKCSVCGTDYVVP